MGVLFHSRMKNMSSELLKGKYQLVKSVGKGGFSEVFLAHDVNLNKYWAIKKIDKATSDKNRDYAWRQEIELMRGLDNPNLLRIVDFFEDDKFAYVVMDFVDGAPLDEMLLSSGKFSEKVVVDFGMQLSRILIYLHSVGIVYRDMKPQNIIISASGRVRLLDFGAARYYDPKKTSDTVNLGTVGYAAPEQYLTDVQTDERTDVYNLGATLFHLVTGISPVANDLDMSKIRNYLPSISRKFEYIIAKCMAPNPNDRYKNAIELLYDLMNIDDNHKDRLVRAKRSVIVLIVLIMLFISGVALAITFHIMYNNEMQNAYNQYLNPDPEADFNSAYGDYWAAYYLYPEKYDTLYPMLLLMEDKRYYSFGITDDIYQTYSKMRDKGLPIDPLLDANINFEFGYFAMHLLPKTEFTDKGIKLGTDQGVPRMQFGNSKELDFFTNSLNNFQNYYSLNNVDYKAIDCSSKDYTSIKSQVNDSSDVIETKYCASKYIVQLFNYAKDVEDGNFANILGDNYQMSNSNNLADKSNTIDDSKYIEFSNTINKMHEFWNSQIYYQYQLYNKYLILSINYYIINGISLHEPALWNPASGLLLHLLQTSKSIISDSQSINDIDSNDLRNTILLLNKFTAENMQIYGILNNKKLLDQYGLTDNDINLALNPPEYQRSVSEFEEEVYRAHWKPDL